MDVQHATPELFERTEWEKTPLGARQDWPQALTCAARLILASPLPMALLAGPQGILIYNDGYAAIAGHRHPGCYGQSALTTWPEAADFNAEILRRVLSGETLSYRDTPMTLHRNGVAENVWFNLDYSPVRDEAGHILAVFAVVIETTAQILSQQALAFSREQFELALNASTLVGTWDWHVREDRVYSDEKFVRLYGVDTSLAAQGTPIAHFTDAIHPDDQASARDAILQAMTRGEKLSIEYRLLQSDGSVRWVLAEGLPLMDETGQCIRFHGITVDITEQRQAAEAHAKSETAFRTLADAMPQMVWSTRPDGYHDYYNARWYEFTGMPAGTTDGEAWNGMFHEDEREDAWAAWRHSLATGEPYQIEYRLRHHSGQYRWVLGRALPVRDENGDITRWYGTCTDIHDARTLQAEREVVAHELSHRIKNIFSVLGGLIALSARSAPHARDFADHLRRRIEAMGRAHDFVRPHSKSSRPIDIETTVFGLLERLLEPYAMETGGTRIVLSGDDLPIRDGAATPLALLLHELATNATKYGALSSIDGRLTIHGTHEGEHYRIDWTETGGPAVAVQTPQDGFGSRLMTISVEGQLGGTLSRTWDADGLKVSATLPVEALSRSSKLSR